jgi:hypothetical protein
MHKHRRTELIIPVSFSEQVDTTVQYILLHIGTWGLAIQCTISTAVLLFAIDTVTYCDIA